MTKVAVPDDWQGVARSSADWSPLSARAEVVFFAQAFDDEDEAAAKLADFEIVLSMRERTPLPGSLINRLPRLRMLGITGGHNASLDTATLSPLNVASCRFVLRVAACCRTLRPPNGTKTARFPDDHRPLSRIRPCRLTRPQHREDPRNARESAIRHAQALGFL